MAKTSLARSGQVLAGAFGAGLQLVVGTLVSVEDDGTVYVDYPGNVLGPLPARLVGPVAGAPMPTGDGGPPVALAFDNGDRSRPLVLGLVMDRWNAGAPIAAVSTSPGREVVVDGRTLVLNAEQELVLRCGNASIQLRRDGKLVIKGTELVSRASGTNKIKGGLVNIN